MAEPKLENGYTRIANELLEAICRLSISGSELRILLYIIRRTYGFSRSSAEIPLSEISRAVGVRREHIQKSLKKLSEKNIIELRTSGGITPQTISLVKDYEKWSDNCGAEKVLQESAAVAENRNSTVAEKCSSGVAETCSNSVAETCSHTFKEKKKPAKERVNKAAYGDNSNVYLSDKEYDELIRDYGQELTDRYIGRADRWLSSAGAKVTDCAALIRKWLEQDGAEKDCGKWKKYEALINLY